jgi:hypothetical protein
MSETATSTKHVIKWWVYTGGMDENMRRERIRRTASMRGFWPGYDVECSCGWETKTGGAVKSYIEQEVWSHKWDHNLHAFQQNG